jgi:hypothetical protein
LGNIHGWLFLAISDNDVKAEGGIVRGTMNLMGNSDFAEDVITRKQLQ